MCCAEVWLTDGGVAFNGVTRAWEDDSLLRGITTGVCGRVLSGLLPCTKSLVKVKPGEPGKPWWNSTYQAFENKPGCNFPWKCGNSGFAWKVLPEMIG